MNTRASPEDPGEKGGPRWIEGPTATPCQPEAKPQMAHLYDNGDGPGTQSIAVAESNNFPCNPCRGEGPPSVDPNPMGSGIVRYDSGWTPGGAFRRERLIVVPCAHDDGRLAQWTYDMLSGRWAQPKDMDDDPDPAMAETFLPRSPPGPRGVTLPTISLDPKKCRLPGDLLTA